MPFDGIDSAVAKSLQTLELMEGRLQGGRKWTRHFMFREGGKMCLLGANYFGCDLGVGRQPDRALEYLARAIEPASRAKDWSDRGWIETTTRTSTIAVPAMAKSSGFCAPRKRWPAPTLLRSLEAARYLDRLGGCDR